jgi:Predicted esterase of the alpha-beta hydrolase superfamily
MRAMTAPECSAGDPAQSLPWADAEPVVLQAGDWCFHEGDPADACYRVASGRVEIIRETAAGTPRLARLGPGDRFGELALLTGEARTAGARAVRDSVIHRLDRATFEQHVLTDPALAHSLARSLAKIVRERETVDASSTRRHPSTLAIVAHDRHADVDAFAAALIERLRAIVTAAPIGAHDTTPAGLGATLDRAERDHDVVVLVAAPTPGSAPGESVWERACVRQADRVLMLAAQPVHPGDRSWPAGAVELVTTGVAADSHRHRALVSDLAPAEHHRVRPGHAGDLGRIARDLAGRSVGLVLSGGGARGLAHLGVLRALEEHGVTIDRVGGTSIGAIVAALVALELDAATTLERCRSELVERRPFSDFTVPRVALLRTRRAEVMLGRLFGTAYIEDLTRPYFCVSADLVSGRAVTHRSGPLVDAIGASISLPGMAPPRRDGNRLLVDGGVLDNLPVRTMRALGAGTVIAVDVSGTLRRTPDGRLPSIIETLGRASVLGGTATLNDQRAAADVLITPAVDDVGIMDWKACPRAVEAGHRAAVTALRGVGAVLDA